MMDASFCEGVYSFVIEKWGALKEGTKVFEKVINERMNRKAADQLGVILMGYWLLREGTVPSIDEAVLVVSEIDESWVDESSGEGNDDNVDCLDHLCQSVVKNLDGRESPIIRVIDRAKKDLKLMGGDGSGRELLRMYGMDVDEDSLYVANNHPKLAEIFRATKWEGGWAKALMRLPKSEKKRRRINTGNPIFCVSVSYNNS